MRSHPHARARIAACAIFRVWNALRYKVLSTLPLGHPVSFCVGLNIREEVKIPPSRTKRDEGKDTLRTRVVTDT